MPQLDNTTIGNDVFQMTVIISQMYNTSRRESRFNTKQVDFEIITQGGHSVLEKNFSRASILFPCIVPLSMILTANCCYVVNTYNILY